MLAAGCLAAGVLGGATLFPRVVEHRAEARGGTVEVISRARACPQALTRAEAEELLEEQRRRLLEALEPSQERERAARPQEAEAVPPEKLALQAEAVEQLRSMIARCEAKGTFDAEDAAQSRGLNAALDLETRVAIMSPLFDDMLAGRVKNTGGSPF